MIKAKDLAELVQSGTKVTVKISDDLWDESWGCQGMVADIAWVAKNEGDNTYNFSFDYNPYRENNLALQPRNYFLKKGGTGTAFEAGMMDEEEVVYDSEEEISVDVVLTGFLAEYVASKSDVSYTEWLEKQLEESRSTEKRPQ